LQTAVELAPELLPAQAKLGQALLLTGNPAAAIPHLELAAPLDVDGSIHFQLATAYRRTGKTELATRTLARRREIEASRSSSHR
jgi:predicted Zn-dependent protease